MRRYVTSRFRLGLLIFMLGAVVFTTTYGFAQNSPATGPAGTAGTTTTGAPKEGLFQIIIQNIDPVFVIIMLLSITGLTLIIQGFMKNRTGVVIPPETINRIRDMIAARQFKELIDFTDVDDSFVSKALNPALKRAPSFTAMKEAMETAIGEQTAEQFRRIEYLNIIGNLGPLLGLLGTVLGMIDAFSAMKAAGGAANPADLAGGISKALAHTFLGLFLAVPCLAAFGVLRTIVDRLTVRGALIAEELLLMVKPQEAKPLGPAGAAAAGARATPQPTGLPRPGFVAAPSPSPSISPQT
jgi:biopolymer transport protein ExbB